MVLIRVEPYSFLSDKEQIMHNYYIESFKVTKLWGYRDIDLPFYSDVNILIGPNGSGKTTVLNLLHSILTTDLSNITNIKFDQAEIKLRSFKGKSIKTIKVYIEEDLLKLKLGKKVYSYDIHSLSIGWYSQVIFLDDSFDDSNRIIRQPKGIDEIINLVPLVWLPVNRRLPVTEDEEKSNSRRKPLESVDIRLDDLLEDLSRYHSILNSRLSERYGDFERQVLSVILYSKDHDQVNSILEAVPTSLPTESEKDQLRKTFDDAGLLDKQMQNKINDHFAAAEDAVKRIRDNPEPDNILEDIVVLPLISRTKDMVKYARELEEDREKIFAPLHLYENTVNVFLEDKTIKVDESGDLKIKLSSKSELNWRSLSSGEKQILILLTQALLKLDEPVVYIADEPELSLHVTWQEKLLESLATLGGQKQIIVATHSPDIVGKYRDNVIRLGEET